MVNHLIECGYCKEKVARTNYGKHLLSKRHKEEFVKENQKEIHLALHREFTTEPRTTAENVAYFKVNKQQCRLCFTCKRHYFDKITTGTGREEVMGHFDKYPACKEKYLDELKRFVAKKKPAVNSDELEKKDREIRYWKQEATLAKGALEDVSEQADWLNKCAEIVLAILGDAGGNIDDLDARFEAIKSQYSLPLYT